MSSIIKKSFYQSNAILQRQEDGYINATVLCKMEGKEFSNWRRTKQADSFIKELSSVLHISQDGLVQSSSGGTPEMQGSWIHPQLAINLAQYLSPKFAVEVSRIIYEWNETKNLTEEQKQFREIMKHTDIQEQRRNGRNLNGKIIAESQSLVKIHKNITTAISGKSPSKWKALGSKRREFETFLIEEGKLKPHKRTYKLRDVVSGLAVIRVENKPIACAISLAHNCMVEKDAPLDLSIEAGKSSLQLFKNLQKIENFNKKQEQIK